MNFQGENISNYHYEDLMKVHEWYKKLGLENMSVIIDCNHANSNKRYLEQIRREKFNSEDMVYYFLSREFTDDGLFMPGIDDAARFSLDAQPGRFFRELPFGCHAWLKNDADFWSGYITSDIFRSDRQKTL
jgi:hypothetical protein